MQYHENYHEIIIVFCTVTMQVWKCRASTAQNECIKYVNMHTGNPGSVIVPQHKSSKITVQCL